MDFLIETAAAQATGAGEPSLLGGLLPLVLIFVVFYFLLIRPQTKRAKEHKAMVEALSTGDEVITAGGVLGKITSVSDSFLEVEVADGVRVKVQRNSIGALMPKGTVKSA